MFASHGRMSRFTSYPRLRQGSLRSVLSIRFVSGNECKSKNKRSSFHPRADLRCLLLAFYMSASTCWLACWGLCFGWWTATTAAGIDGQAEQNRSGTISMAFIFSIRARHTRIAMYSSDEAWPRFRRVRLRMGDPLPARAACRSQTARLTDLTGSELGDLYHLLAIPVTYC